MIITPSTDPNTMSFWHGGNLDNINSFTNQRKGKFEFGSGLYLTTHYGTAERYARGSRKLYMVTVSKGMDMNDVNVPVTKLMNYFDINMPATKKKAFLSYIERYNKNGSISLHIVNNIMINHELLKSSDTESFKNFIVSCGADYLMVDNAFGWHEKMMVLFNNKKIVKITRVNPKDTIEVFNLPTEWNG
jgi:hypothetical protein